MHGNAIVRHVVTFGRVLREVGIEVGPGRVVDAVRGLGAVDLTRQEDVYFTLRQTLVSRHDELELFDRAFTAWFLRGPVAPLVRQKQERQLATRVARDTLETSNGDDVAADGDPLELGASSHELLRERDFAEMTPEEFERARRLMDAIARSRPLRTSRRRSPDPRGDVLDMRRMLRRCLRSGGDPVDQPWKSRKAVPRKLVVLCDISGSMDAYARALLLFLHALVGSGHGVEAFAFGTRLTRLTGNLGTRDPEAALARATEAAIDWGSGTRIGGSLAEFNTVYGRRALSRGAVVVIVSDGWERGDPALVGREMARLARLAHRIVWINPRVSARSFSPQAGGMAAALEHCDALVSGHSLEALEEVVDAIAADDDSPEWRATVAAKPDAAPVAGSGDADEPWASATPVPGSSVAMPSGYGPKRGNTTPGWSLTGR